MISGRGWGALPSFGSGLSFHDFVNRGITFYQIVRSPLSSYGVPRLAHVPVLYTLALRCILPLFHINLGVMQRYIKASGMLNNNKRGACFL